MVYWFSHLLEGRRKLHNWILRGGKHQASQPWVLCKGFTSLGIWLECDYRHGVSLATDLWHYDKTSTSTSTGTSHILWYILQYPLIQPPHILWDMTCIHSVSPTSQTNDIMTRHPPVHPLVQSTCSKTSSKTSSETSSNTATAHSPNIWCALIPTSTSTSAGTPTQPLAPTWHNLWHSPLQHHAPITIATCWYYATDAVPSFYVTMLDAAFLNHTLCLMWPVFYMVNLFLYIWLIFDCLPSFPLPCNKGIVISYSLIMS